MEQKVWTVARFPIGEWTGGGRVSDPTYEACEVYRVPAMSLDQAKKKAQAVRRKLVRNGSPLPTQAQPLLV